MILNVWLEAIALLDSLSFDVDSGSMNWIRALKSTIHD